jgi:TonB family protein
MHYVISRENGKLFFRGKERMKNSILINISISMIFHIMILTVVASKEDEVPEKREPVKIVVKTPEVPPVEEKKVIPPKEKKVAREKRAVETPKPASAPPPVFGVAKENLNNTGSGLSVPVGNTLMVEDDGKRNPDPGVLQDLSSDAQIIINTVKIKYTDEAIDAGLQGSVIVEVMVDESGTPVEAVLKKKVGYKMDENIKKAALNSKFKPRLNRYGKPLAGWTDVKFILTLE